MQLLRTSLQDLKEQFAACIGQMQSSLRTVQTIVPAVLQRTANRTAEMNGKPGVMATE